MLVAQAMALGPLQRPPTARIPAGNGSGRWPQAASRKRGEHHVLVTVVVCAIGVNTLSMAAPQCCLYIARTDGTDSAVAAVVVRRTVCARLREYLAWMALVGSPRYRFGPCGLVDEFHDRISWRGDGRCRAARPGSRPVAAARMLIELATAGPRRARRCRRSRHFEAGSSSTSWTLESERVLRARGGCTNRRVVAEGQGWSR